MRIEQKLKYYLCRYPFTRFTIFTIFVFFHGIENTERPSQIKPNI